MPLDDSISSTPPSRDTRVVPDDADVIGGSGRYLLFRRSCRPAEDGLLGGPADSGRFSWRSYSIASLRAIYAS